MITIGWWPFLLMLLASAGMTLLAKRYAVRKRLMDEPGERRSHRVATPRGGGIAMMLTIATFMLWRAWTHPAQSASILFGLAGLVLVAGVGWRDDHGGVRVRWRLLVHVLAGLFAGMSAYWVSESGLHAVVIATLAVMLINAWNFMDGIDGIATLQAIVVAVAYAGLALLAAAGASSESVLLALAVISACIGFLPFNFPKARIFMGDVGSGALGYVLALLPAWLNRPETTSPIPWLLPLLPFGIDTLFTLLRRVINGEQWWTPHVTHVYQISARSIGRHPPVSLLYATATGLLTLLAWWMATADMPHWPMLLGAFAALAIVHLTIASRHGTQRGSN